LEREERARADWGRIGDDGHGVQFYADDDALIELLACHVGTALVCGDAAVTFAMQTHQDALNRRLERRGFDVEVARAEGRYIAHDAEETLQRCMVSGWPNRGRFQAIVQPAIERAARAVSHTRPRIAAFGEMVSLLWTKGNRAAALRVEELWNELARTHRFALCCAYPMKAFTSQQDAAPFMKICAQHSHVFPVERRTMPRAEPM
jgi:hypothetical protein